MSNGITWDRLGWKAYQKWAKASVQFPAKVVCHRSQFYTVVTPEKSLVAEVSGKLKFEAQYKADLPTVGDWVSLDSYAHKGSAQIKKVLPRKTWLSRKVIGELTDAQLLAANCDIVFIVSALDDEFNANRIERYVTSIKEGRAKPVILLNKVDIGQDTKEKCDELKKRGFDDPVLMSVKQNIGLDQLSVYLKPQQTIAVVGSSGVGKSSLMNVLLGREKTKVGLVRAYDGKGMHTTTHREVFALESGALLIDMPGIKEVQLWSEGKGLEESFEDIQTLAASCRFSDCKHESEPGCAVQAAIKNGAMVQERWDNFLKQRTEIVTLKSKKIEKTWLKKGKEKRQKRKQNKSQKFISDAQS